MQLASILDKNFSASIRKRGKVYFQQRRVKIRSGSATELGAVVVGSEPYTILLKWSGEELAVLCTCPYFVEEGGPCKHLWAAILAADEQGHLAAATFGATILLDTDTLLDQFEDGGEETLQPGSTIIHRHKVPPPSRAVPLPGVWKAQLNRIAEKAIEPPARGNSWPEHAEVLYLLDVAKSRGSQGLVLTIASREPKKQGGWKNNGKPCVISRARIPSLPVATDREVLSTLAGGGPYHPYSQGPYDPYDRGPDSFFLPPSLAEAILPTVLRTGRCFLLSILGAGLRTSGIAYEYLDGKTQDRQAPVERFQNDPASRLFLISLKAGGLGLNLTAADYVFILDPGGTRPSRPRPSTAPIASASSGRSSLIA